MREGCERKSFLVAEVLEAQKRLQRVARPAGTRPNYQ